MAFPTTNLVSRWGLSDLTDSVGSNTLTNNNSVTFVTGILGNAANMVAASSQYLTAADSASLSFTGNFTLAGWFKFATNTGTQQLITKRTSAGNQRSYNFFYNAGNLGADVFSDGSTGSQKTVSWTPTVGIWYHLAFTYATSGTGIFYVDGVQQGATQTSMVTSVYDGTALFSIGCLFDPAQEFFNGSVDDVAVWNTTLTAQQVRDAHLSYSPLSSNGLVSYYKLDESSGNAADNVGSFTLTNTDATYSTGKINNGAVFNGSSAKLVTSSDLTTPKSISAWVKKTTNGGEDDIFAKWYTAKQDLVFWTDATGQVGIYANAFGENFNTTITLTTGVWYHVCYVNKIDGTNSKIFINGVEAASATGTTLSNSTSINASIGANSAESSNYFDGMIDEVGIWSRALTADEVSQLYNSNRALAYPLTAPTLYGGVAYYKLDESSGNASDSIGTNTLTNTNATYAAAKINNGASLDGSTAYFTGSTSAYQVFTYNAWVYNTNHSATHTIKGGLYETSYGAPQFRIETNQKIGLIKAGVAAIDYSSGTVPDTTWTMVTVTYDVSGNYVFYINGSASGSGTNLQTFLNKSILIGATQDNASVYAEKMNGLIDEVSIFNRALTSTEVTELYAAGAGKQYPWSGEIYTLACAVGSFALTGIDTLFNKVLIMACAVGEFALTGIDIAFVFGKGIICSVGNFIVTGFPIRFTGQGGWKWRNQTKNSATWTNTSKNTSSWSNQEKN